MTDRVVIINEGRIIADGHIDELHREAMGDNRVFVGVRPRPPRSSGALRGLARLAEVCSPWTRPRGHLPLRDARPLRRRPRGRGGRPGPRAGWDLTELHESPYSLEDTFIALTRAAGSRQEVAS